MHPSTFLATYPKELHVECGHFSGNQKNQKKLKLLFLKNNSSVWEKRAKKSQLMKIHPQKNDDFRTFYDNWLHFGNPEP